MAYYRWPVKVALKITTGGGFSDDLSSEIARLELGLVAGGGVDVGRYGVIDARTPHGTGRCWFLRRACTRRSGPDAFCRRRSQMVPGLLKSYRRTHDILGRNHPMSVIRVPKSIRDFGGWGAVAIEIAIVTVGILVAFSLNSWWEGRQQRAREIVHLKALHQEFAANRQRLRDKEEFEKRLNERLLALIGLMRADPPPPRLDLPAK